MDLSTLRRRGEAAQRELAEASLLLGSGRLKSWDLSAFYARYSDLGSSEAYALAQEGLERANEAPDKERWRRLTFLAYQFQEGRATARPLEARLSFEATHEVRFEGESIPWHELSTRLAHEPIRERRFRLARAEDLALPALDKELSHRVGACQELANRLGFPSYEALWAKTSGIDLEGLAAQAQSVLARTEDAYRDLMGFGLRRIVGPIGLKPRGEAARHDLVRFQRLQPLDDLFPRRRLLPTAQQFLEQVGLSPDAQGKIELELQERAGYRALPTAAALEVPFQVRAFVPRLGGAGELFALLSVLGRAQRLAHLHPDAPFEEKRLADPSLGEGFGLAFALLLADSKFLERGLDADPRIAMEAARLVALSSLIDLRRGCASLLFERTLYREGPTEGLEGLSRELMQKALLVEWPVERWLFDVEPGFASAIHLRGQALAASLHFALLEAANEDYWRNPRTGSLLRKWWALSGDDAPALSKHLGSELSLERAADRLVAIAAR